jgi:hypothetical protein
MTDDRGQMTESEELVAKRLGSLLAYGELGSRTRCWVLGT